MITPPPTDRLRVNRVCAANAGIKKLLSPLDKFFHAAKTTHRTSCTPTWILSAKVPPWAISSKGSKQYGAPIARHRYTRRRFLVVYSNFSLNQSIILLDLQNIED